MDETGELSLSLSFLSTAFSSLMLFFFFFFKHCIWNNCSLHHCFDFLQPEFCFFIFILFLVSRIHFSFCFTLACFSTFYYVVFPDYPAAIVLFLNGYTFLHSMGLPNTFTFWYQIFLWVVQFASLKGTWVFLPSCFAVFNSRFPLSPHYFTFYSCSNEGIFPHSTFAEKSYGWIAVMFFASLFGNLILP